MKQVSDNKVRFILVVVIAQTIGLAISAMVSLFGAVERQSIEHQKALSPIFEFVIDEIVQPLNFAIGIAKASRLHDLVVSDQFDEDLVVAEIKRLSVQTGYEFFVASETAKKQYNANGSVFDLLSDDIKWYDQTRAKDKEVFGIIGNNENPHLYFDVKVFSNSSEFAGFIGLGIPVSSFISRFDSGSSVSGYEIVIANDIGNIIFATDKSLRAIGDQMSQLSDAQWYKALSDEQRQLTSLNNEIISVDGNKLLIAETSLKEIGWKFYLVNPLDLRKGQLLNSFLLQTAFIFLLVFLLIILTKFIRDMFIGSVKNKIVLDSLTGIPIRDYLTSKFRHFQQQNVSICLLVLDIDHFKSVNDNYGHAGGDAVLRETVGIIKKELRETDVIVRWGGEEFVILLPNCSKQIGRKLAERLRSRIEQNTVNAQNHSIKVTVSIGVTHTELPEDLTRLFNDADEKLYTAKRSGRNQVASDD